MLVHADPATRHLHTDHEATPAAAARRRPPPALPTPPDSSRVLSTCTACDATVLNVSDTLTPATQYMTTVEMRNALGWGPKSNLAWLSTIPDVPSTPPKPVCIPANAKADEMYVGIQPAAAHGAPLLEYEVSISTASADLRYVGSVPADVEPLAFTATSVQAANFSGIDYTPETIYLVSTRARNQVRSRHLEPSVVRSWARGRC